MSLNIPNKNSAYSKETLLEIKNLGVKIKEQSKEKGNKILNNISLTVKKGEITALVGESGSGKSVTALSIMQLLPAAFVYTKQVKIIFKGAELTSLKEEDLQSIRGNQISMIFQEPMTALNPLHTIKKQVTEAVFLHQTLTKKSVEKKVREVFDMVGLSDLQDRLNAYPHELSGGQRQRVMIAMALVNEPELLIADEPTTALDVTIQAKIVDLIQDLQKRMKMGVLFISHDLNLVRRISDNIIIMQNGKVVEAGRTASVLKSPRHAYTKDLLNSIPKGEPVRTPRKKEIILQAEKLKIHFPKEKSFFGKITSCIKAVDGVSFKLHKGETLGIIGESGSGKSTLAYGLLRIVKSQGKIVFQDKEISKYNYRQMQPLRKKIQFVFQDPFGSLNPRMTIGEIINEGLKAHGIKQNLNALLEEVGFSKSMISRYPHEFSGGQRQRIAIARALALNPELIIFDEPTSALDVTTQAKILNLLKNLQQKYKLSYIFISHDLRVIKAISHKIVIMKSGKIIESGSFENIFKKSKHQYTKDLLEAAFLRKTI